MNIYIKKQVFHFGHNIVHSFSYIHYNYKEKLEINPDIFPKLYTQSLLTWVLTQHYAYNY